MRRRLRRAVLVAGLVGVPAVGLLAWLWWFPAAIEDRIRSTVAARFDATVTIEDVDLSFSGIDVEGFRLEGDGLDVAIDALELGGGLFSLASEGTAAITSVSATGCEVTVDPEGVATLRRLRAERTDGQGETQSSGAPVDREIRLEGKLSVTDDEGELVVAEGELEHLGDQVRVRHGSLSLGEAPSDVFSVDNVRAQLQRGDEGWSLYELVVETSTLTLGTQDENVAMTKDRVRSLLVGDDEELAEEEPQEEESTPERGWLQRMADGGSIRIERFDALRSAGARPVVSELNAEVTRHESELHLVGQGLAENNGKAEWDLWVAPDELRGRGNVTLEALPFDLFVPLLPQLPWFNPAATLVDADLQLRADSAARIAFEGSAGVRNLGLSHERIAPEPVSGLTMGVEGRGAWNTVERMLEIESGKVSLGTAEASVSGEMEWTEEHYRVDLDASLASSSCNTVVGAIPSDLLAELRGFSWDGQMAGRAHLAVDSRDLDATELRVRIINGCRFITVPAVADLRRVHGPFIHRVREPDGSFFEMTAGPGSENWASIHAVSPFFVQSVVGHEDGGFFSHGGFAMYAIRGAMVRNLKAGRYVAGASTITMQLAKNLFLHREKTLARKVQEVLLTWWLESALSKRDLIELYLNIIEYGPGIYGIVDAAEHYFGRQPSELSPAESAFLACILPNPKGYHGNWDRGELSTRMKNRVRRFLNHLASRGRIDDEALAYGLAELETMRFYRPGQPVPGRVIPGHAGELPFATAEDMPTEEVEEDTYDDGYDYQRSAPINGG